MHRLTGPYKETYSYGMKQTARIFKSVADETRLRILLLLACHDELCVCDLMAALDLPQSTVSRHLAYLKNAGWLDDRRSGIWMHYSVAANRTAIHHELLASLVKNLNQTPQHISDQQRIQTTLHQKRCQ